MPVSGIVVTLAQPGPQAELAVQWLASDARFALGETEDAEDRHLPVTIDTADEQANKDCWAELQAHAGIEFVDVVCVFLS